MSTVQTGTVSTKVQEDIARPLTAKDADAPAKRQAHPKGQAQPAT